MLYISGPAELPSASPTNPVINPATFVQSLLFTSDDGSELTGAVVQTEDQGAVACHPGSMAWNAAMTLIKQFDGTDSAEGWVTVKDERGA